MKAVRFRVQNFRNIDDSDWIALERVTAFVGRNESGKSALLKALHKFNPATPEPYDAQREFPRDRYTRDYVAKGSKGSDWPVCSVTFELPTELKTAITEILDDGQQTTPGEAIVTRYYDGTLRIEYVPAIKEKQVSPAALVAALEIFASASRRLVAPAPTEEQNTAAQRTSLIEWSVSWQDRLKAKTDLHNAEGASLLTTFRAEANSKSNPQTADMIEALVATITPMLEAIQRGSILDRIGALIKNNMPVLIYFENYGILDSAVWLPRFIEDLARDKTAPRTRTINAMFKHVGLDPTEITALGREQSRPSQQTEQQISADQRQKDERAIRLNSASIDISARFSAWWSQRRHKIRYHADGDYFRIWIADDRRPYVEIELEARSKGFQWFFSFYLVFLVESEEGHKDAILLLDEPGLDLHPTAQQELIGFFEQLSERNQLIYTTHSPFLIDGDHLHRVRPVTEDKTGHSTYQRRDMASGRRNYFPSTGSCWLRDAPGSVPKSKERTGRRYERLLLPSCFVPAM
jgi:predicted ATPase